MQQLKTGFKRAINWNNYQSEVLIERQNQYLDYLIEPIFQGVNRLFVLSDTAILNIKRSDYCCIINLISRNEAINITQNSGLTKKSGTL